jgi:hypothetical protein
MRKKLAPIDPPMARKDSSFGLWIFKVSLGFGNLGFGVSAIIAQTRALHRSAATGIG